MSVSLLFLSLKPAWGSGFTPASALFMPIVLYLHISGYGMLQQPPQEALSEFACVMQWPAGDFPRDKPFPCPQAAQRSCRRQGIGFLFECKWVYKAVMPWSCWCLWSWAGGHWKVLLPLDHAQVQLPWCSWVLCWWLCAMAFCWGFCLAFHIPAPKHSPVSWTSTEAPQTSRAAVSWRYPSLHPRGETGLVL